ncbi:MAG: Ig-like domain-containing protein, partial [Paludibacteraceae bacterium]|nr:Ig-like domain-containing protein [Paludibacteraceae bacterium]
MKVPAHISSLLIGLAVIVLLAGQTSCANRGAGPQGGPRDSIPPRILTEMPQNGSVNWQRKNIEVVFDENITVDNIQKNVLISPPQKKMPDIQAINRKLSIRFDKADTLLPNTTYTIDFGNAIQDNNEKNALEDYSFSFSTGPVIDTLQISGMLIDAETLNPMESVLVGIYDADTYADTTFSTTPFKRIGRSNSKGFFRVSNLAPGTYRVFALNDNDHNYMFNISEGVAVLDSSVTPSCHVSTTSDTIWTDDAQIDTVYTRTQATYHPSDLLLRYYTEQNKRQYLVSTERKEQHKITLLFNAPSDTLPALMPIDTQDAWVNRLRLQANETKDTLTYWICDSTVYERDTLRFAINYLKTDSIYQLQPQTDTLRAIFRRPRAERNTQRTKSMRPTPLKIKVQAGGEVDVYKPLLITADSPVDTLRKEKLHLLQWHDSISTELTFDISPTDSCLIDFSINYEWQPEGRYEFVMDSAAFVDVYGKANEKQSSKFNIKSLDRYAKLIVILDPMQEDAVIQILNTNDKPVRSLPAQSGGTVFEYLDPGDYYMRLFVDADRNGIWTTGNLKAGRQPEEVYYYPA